MEKIFIVGLGAGDLDQLQVKVYRRLLGFDGTVFLRTKEHPLVSELEGEGVRFTSFDSVYERHEDFESVYEEIVASLLSEAENSEVLYAVPGHPMLAERTVQLLLEKAGDQLEILGGQSYLDDLFTALQIDPIDGFQFVDGTSFGREELQYDHHIIFCQVYDEFIASEVKLALLEDLPYDYPVTIVEAAGAATEKIREVALEDLDRRLGLNNLRSLYIAPVPKDLRKHQFSQLREIIRTLRGPKGCEWDQRQTHESLKRYALEEVYELLAAIDEQDDEAIIEELGDVLLQVMLHSQIGEDDGYFTIDDVILTLSEKMIHRHPHVFKGKDAESIGKTWQELKQEEKGEGAESILDSLQENLPGLSRAFELQQEAAKVGFDWSESDPIWAKLSEEILEVKEALKMDDPVAVEEEFGDVLFVLANLTRFYNVHPELALHRTNEKFLRRFKHIEKRIAEQGKDIYKVSLEEMDDYWDEAKEGGDE